MTARETFLAAALMCGFIAIGMFAGLWIAQVADLVRCAS